jgi:SAM-dependent methyltransferase
VTYQGGCRAVPVEKTWALIEPHLKPGWVVVDIGCAEGWFTRAAAEKGCIAFGLDQSVEPTLTDLPVAFARHRFGLDDLEAWSAIPATIDVVLALNVLHYLSWDEAVAWVTLLGRFVPNLIVEMPETTEPTTIGHIFAGRIEELLRTGYPVVELLGEHEVGPTHRRQVWRARREAFQRDGLSTNFVRAPAHRNKPRHGLRYDGEWKLIKAGTEQPMVRGIALFTLLNFDVTYPSREWFIEAVDIAARKRHEAQGGHIDNVAPISLLWCGDHLELYDCSGYESRWEQDLERTKTVIADWSIETYVREFTNRWA